MKMLFIQSGGTIRTIILTGSMRLDMFSDSDAPFNVGTAIGALNVLSPGAYITMDGRVYVGNKVTRDNKTGQFIET